MRNLKIKHKIIILYLMFISGVFLFPFLFPLNSLVVESPLAGKPPSLLRLFGSDELGRDLFTLCLHGARLSLIIGVIGALLSCLVGSFVGVISGYFGGKTDAVLCRLMDISLSFPSLLLALGISVVMPPGIISILIALLLVSWAEFARLIRGVVIDVKSRDFILASVLMGSSHKDIILRHVLPHTLPYIWVSFSLKIGAFILTESSLSFLGVGVSPDTPTLGGLIASGKDFLITLPWIPLIPGLVVSILVWGSNLFGDKMQQYIDN